jgi:hypothetical protein
VEVELFGKEQQMVDVLNFLSKYFNEYIVNITLFSSFDFDPTTRHTVWSILLGATFNWLAIYGSFLLLVLYLSRK